MAHHHHDQGGTYYLDQLCTIAACGTLGGVAAMMYYDGRLRFILTPFFFAPVLIGGVALIAMAAVRAITLWREAGAAAAHEHPHDHDHVHDHDHAHDHDHNHVRDHDHDHVHGHSHGHDHGHEHGWTPARYAVLMLPIVLFFLNLPNSTFSAAGMDLLLGHDKSEGVGKVVDKHQEVSLGFQELTNAADIKATRDALQGKTGVLTGKYAPRKDSDKEFTLFRVKMTCCAADAIPIQVQIVCPEGIPAYPYGTPVEVKGLIDFPKAVGKDKYIPTLWLKSSSQVKKIDNVPDYGVD